TRMCGAKVPSTLAYWAGTTTSGMRMAPPTAAARHTTTRRTARVGRPMWTVWAARSAATAPITTEEAATSAVQARLDGHAPLSVATEPPGGGVQATMPRP